METLSTPAAGPAVRKRPLSRAPKVEYVEPVGLVELGETRPPGRRERKKLQTRETIAREGLRLFLANGFRATTIAQIAEAADVAESTIFLHFATKEDILFAGHAEEAATLVDLLAVRPPDSTTLAVLHRYLHDLSEPDRWDADLWWHRGAVIRDDPALRAQERARWADVVRPALEESFARDFGGDDPVRAPVLAAMTLSAMFELGRIETEVEAARAGGAAWKRAATERLLAALEAASGPLGG